MIKVLYLKLATLSPMIHLALGLPQSGKGKRLVGIRESPTHPLWPPRTKQNGNQLLQILGNPSSGWMEGAGADWKGSLLTGDWLRENQPCSISLLSPAWVTSLSTEHLRHPRPDGRSSKSAFCSMNSLNARDFGLAKEMHFFLHWAFTIYFFSAGWYPSY